jgi:hypothetical protein
MRRQRVSSRIREGIVSVAIAGTVIAASLAATSPVLASSNAAIPGQLQAFAVSGSFQIHQLFSGADGQLWFVTTTSRLGKISATGQATLTTVVLPHGIDTAVIAGAGPEGVWSFADDDTATFSAGACDVTLVTPAGVVEPVTLPAIAAPSECGGGAADASGNLWVSLSNPCGSFTCGRRVSFVAEITPSRAVTLFPPVRPGAKAGPVTLGNDGAIWTLGGNPIMTMGRYTPTSSTTGIQVPFAGEQVALLPSSGGMFWGARPVRCSGQTTGSCFRVERFSPGNTTRSFFIFPVGIALAGGFQLGDGSDGSLWQAGAERTDPDRFFRMNTNGTIDRSTAFPTPGGSALHDDGTLAVGDAGTLWTSARTTSGHEYLVRFQPAP